MKTLTQCAHCPWKKRVRASADIPNGYSRDMHADLRRTIAGQPGYDEHRVMACHESPIGNERMCAGWAANQLGPGNNLKLRMRMAFDPAFPRIRVLGPQHETFDDTFT